MLKKRTGKISIINLLSTIIFILALVLILSTIFFLGAILHTYKVFTREEIVAEITVSRQLERNGVPYFEIVYKPRNVDSGFWSVLGVDRPSSSNSVVEAELVGDQVFFRSDFVRWSDFMTLLNFKSVYKVYAIRGDFDDISNFDEFKNKITSKDREVLIDGGRDEFSKFLQSNSQYLTWFAQSNFISSAGIDIDPENSKRYYLIATEDAMVIEPIE